MSMFFVEPTNIVDCDADIYVNPVNCVGVMGKGVARVFKKTYPEMFKKYSDICSMGALAPGRIFVYYDKNKVIINLATKNHWSDPSKIEWIEEGLFEIKNYLDFCNGLKYFRENNKKQLKMVIPAIGCGNGGLEWEKVKPLIEKIFSDVAPNINILVIEPY